jgi:hypothetical protein
VAPAFQRQFVVEALKKPCDKGGLSAGGRGNLSYRARFWPDPWLRPPDPTLVPDPHRYQIKDSAGNLKRELSISQLYMLRPTYVWAPDVFFRK